jgi:hypothetical protein
MKVGGTEISMKGDPCTSNPEKSRKNIQRDKIQNHTPQAMILGAGLATRF